MTGLGSQSIMPDPACPSSDPTSFPITFPADDAATRMTRMIWLALAALGLIDAVWLVVANFRLTPAGVLAPAASALALVGAAAFLRYRRRNRAAIVLLDGIAQILTGLALGGVLSYLGISANFPFVDRQLALLDGMMGFDWPAYVAWVRAHSMLDGLLYVAYHGTVAELIVVAILLGALRADRIPELTATTLIGLLLTVVISSLFPAADADLYYRAAYPHLVAEVPISDHFALRDGTLREIDLRHLQGLVSFPSFHAILSLLFIYVVRGIRFAVPVGIVVNIPVIAGTLSAGGHYLVDLPGGAVVTVISIALYRLAAHRLAPRHAAATSPWRDPAASDATDLAGAAAD
jgi:hypothetical protein